MCYALRSVPRKGMPHVPEILAAGRATVVVRQSRFHAYAEPAPELEAALARRRALAQEHPGADHVVMAARIAPGVARALDDGEPSGTAGRPLFTLLERAGLVRSALYVVRYFGGTKLGRGGLVRAYQAAAQEALAKAAVGEPAALVRRTLAYPPHLDGAVRAVLARTGAVSLAVAYGAVVEQTVALAAAAVPKLEAALAGRPVRLGEASGGEER
jgi:putative IMPACT (imprinted ancient) family translation regulator